MKPIKLFAAALAAGLLAIPAGITAQPCEVKANDARIIVEVDKALDGLSNEGIINSQDSVISNIKRFVSSNVKLETRYSVLANAFLLSVNSEDIDLIKQVPGVKSVTVDKLHFTETYDGAKNVTIYRDGGSSKYSESDNISGITMNAPELSKTRGGEGVAIAILDNEFMLKKNSAGVINKEYTHETFNDLKVGIKTKFTQDSIATIVKNAGDSFHGKPGSAKNETTYFNKKVPFYYDYGGDTTSPNAQGMPDFDTYSDVAAHGSHVASIAAGNGDTYKGLAPNAQLICMKVFTVYEPTEAFKAIGAAGGSGAYDSAIFNALEDCITLGVDAINMSLGSDLDDFDQDSLTLRTLRSMQDKGIIACIAAGNSGKSAYSFTGAYGNWTGDMVETGIMSSYANVPTTMTVAAGVPLATYFETAVNVNNISIQYEDQVKNRDDDDTTFREEDQKYIWDLTQDGTITDFEFVKVPGYGEAKDYAAIDVRGKIAVVDRGSIDFETKVKNAYGKGAIAVFIIDNDPTATEFSFRCSFGTYVPEIPVALTLYKNRPTWIDVDHGTLTVIKDQILDNTNPYTAATFSTDGATYNYDLKPDITTPGEGIKGAVPPYDKNKYKDVSKYRTQYEWYNGTSMACPNYCGVVALMLGEHTNEDPTSYRAFKDSLNMRVQSTATPMVENNAHNVEVYTSPRIQGAGMANVGNAMTSQVYLEGLTQSGEPTARGKVCLYNNSDIANGNLKVSVRGHNETDKDVKYNAKLVIQYPDVVETNDIIQSDYNNMGELNTYVELVGSANVPAKWIIDGAEVVNEDFCDDPLDGKYIKGVDVSLLKVNDAYKVKTIDEKYYLGGTLETNQKAFYFTGATLPDGSIDRANCWQHVPFKQYQSVKDQILAETTPTTVTFKSDSSLIIGNENDITIPYEITAEQKKKINDFYNYGCAIEGYLVLEPIDENEGVVLNVPFLGFYGDYSKAPAVEPFFFEKEVGKIYPSDLLNDFAKNTMAKDNTDCSSTWIAGYATSPGDIYIDGVTKNDDSFRAWTEKGNNWYKAGTDPLTGEVTRDADGKVVIYAGNSRKSNTMIIQQTVLRSVSKNKVTITSSTGQVVYEGYFAENIGYGDESELYKSHAMASTYIAHRAQIIIPLYNKATGEMFPDGEYTISMKYTLAGVTDDRSTIVPENEQELRYKLIMDNTPSELSVESSEGNIAIKNSAGEVTGHTTGKVLKVNVKEQALSSLVFDKTTIRPRSSTNPDKEGYYGFYKNSDGTYSYEIAANDAAKVTQKNKGRLTVESVDMAHGTNCFILSGYTADCDPTLLPSISSNSLDAGVNFEFQVNAAKDYISVNVFTYDSRGHEVPLTLTQPIDVTFCLEDVLGRSNLDNVKIYDGNTQERVQVTAEIRTVGDKHLATIKTQTGTIKLEYPAAPSNNGCGGNIAATSTLISLLAVCGIGIILLNKKKHIEE